MLIGQHVFTCVSCGRSFVGLEDRASHRCFAPHTTQHWWRLDHNTFRLEAVQVGVFVESTYQSSVIYKQCVVYRQNDQETFAPTAREAVQQYQQRQERRLESAQADVRFFTVRIERARVALEQHERDEALEDAGQDP
jgi:hypothetical protein